MNELTLLANKYLTDKGTEFDGQHNFTSVYYEKLKHLKSQPLNILEVGIFNGSSVKMWRDFFINSTIYCCDIIPQYFQPLQNEPRIISFQTDQSNRNILKESISNLSVKFDIIIDDGSHKMDHQQLTLGILFPYLKSNGYYILEDLHTSLNPKYTNPFGGYDNSTLNMFKVYEDTSKWNSKFITLDEKKYLDSHTRSVDVYGWENTRNKENMSITSIIRK
tara:strand:- start:41 stop:700 length:660 start_codon:yes stop_codon:yes gene_type:complete